MSACHMSTMRIEAAIGVPRFLHADGRGVWLGRCDPSTAVSVQGMPPDGVAVARVRIAVSAFRDRCDSDVSESATVARRNIESGRGNGTSGKHALPTRTAMGASIPGSGREHIGGAVGIGAAGGCR